MAKKTTIIIIILLMLGSVLPKSVLGIGQMTKPIEVKSILRGQTTESTLTLYNSEEEETVYKLVADGVISNWTSFYTIDDSNNSIDEIQIPAKSNIKAVVRFTVPQDAANGVYIGEVAIISVPEKTEGGKVNVSVGARVGRRVSITVTDEEIIEFDTTIIPLDREVGKNDPLRIKIIHTNQSNVSIKPSIQLKITKNGGNIFNAIFPYPEDENPVRPLERKTLSSLIEWQTAGQNNGRYRAEVKVLLNDKVMRENDFHFTVGIVKDDNTANQNKFSEFIAGIGGGNITLGYLLIGGFILLLSIFSFTIIKKRSKKKVTVIKK